MATSPLKNGRIPIVKILIGSLLVGMMLMFFDMRPEEFLGMLGDAAKSIFQILVNIVEWAVPYILLGAVVVVPIWLIVVLWRYFRSRKN